LRGRGGADRVNHGSRRAIIAAFLANLGIALSKFVAFVITGAASMLAEAIHSLADTGNQGLLMLGGSRSRRPADEIHPFGYGTLRYFWAFVVALVLFSMGGLFAIFEGVEKLKNPHELEDPRVAIVVLLVAIVLESFSLRTALRESRVERRGKSILQFVRRTKIPELAVVVLEDIGALIGLGFALFGVSLAAALDEPRWDAVGSLAIGVLLVMIAILLAVEMASLLVGEAAAPEVIARMLKVFDAHPEVSRVIVLRTQHVGPDDIMVTAKLEFDPTLSVARLAEVVNELEVELRSAEPRARTIFIEPDVYRAPEDTVAT
jgi:cation diffusion facilitator family transporter